MKKVEKVRIDFDNSSGLVRIVPRHNLDMESAPQLRKFLMKLLDKQSEDVLVDMEFVGHIDTSALATLVEYALHLREKGGSVFVCGMQGVKTDTLSLQQVSEVLHFCTDCDEAREQMGGGTPTEKGGSEHGP